MQALFRCLAILAVVFLCSPSWAQGPGSHAGSSHGTDVNSSGGTGSTLGAMSPDALERALTASASEGNVDRATEAAKLIVTANKDFGLAHLWLAAIEFKKNNFSLADDHLSRVRSGPAAELTAALGKAWVHAGGGVPSLGLDVLQLSRFPNAAHPMVRYHRALLSDLDGNHEEANREYSALFTSDPGWWRLAVAFAHHASSRGDLNRATRIIRDHLYRARDNVEPFVQSVASRLESGERLAPIALSAGDGFAEVFYGIGEALVNDGNANLGAVYQHIALIQKPDHVPALSVLARANRLSKRLDLAVAAYDRVPTSDIAILRAALSEKAILLHEIGRTDEAKTILEKLISERPGDEKPLLKLADIMRSSSRFLEAVEYYSRLIGQSTAPTEKHWIYWYGRGTSYERLKRWPEAEADLLKALELSPDQPLVLNYLGYSWIEQNVNLNRGLAMLEKAAKAQPKDPYIIDSVGWAHYKLGNLREAVRYLERAVSLKPDEAILLDHLGDALWRLGRHSEARTRWAYALSISEADAARAIKSKMELGLPPLSRQRR